MKYLNTEMNRVILSGIRSNNIIPLKHQHMIHIVSLVQTIAQPSSSDIIVEVGAGSGLASAYMCQKGCSVISMDRDVQFVPYMKHIFGEFGLVPRVVVGDAMCMPFIESAARCTFTVGMVEHYKGADQISILRNICRISNNYAIILYPNAKVGSAFHAFRKNNDHYDAGEEHYMLETDVIRSFPGWRLVEHGGVGVWCYRHELIGEEFDRLRSVHRRMSVDIGGEDLFSMDDIRCLVAKEDSLDREIRHALGFFNYIVLSK